MQVEYGGQIYLDLMKYLAIDDGFSFGQKMAQIEKTAKKRFIEMTDEEVYKTQKQIIEDKQYWKDDKLSDQEFTDWVNTK